MTAEITAIIAEDEPILRAQLKAKLGKLWPELKILADVGDGEGALEAIAEHQPRLAFLDIQMPEMTGVEVAKSLAANREIKCHIVFVTAFDQYAVEAFDTGAIDYVLKPYSDERLQTAIARLKERLGGGAAGGSSQNLEALVAHLSAKLNPQVEKLKWIKANIGSNLRLIPIEWRDRAIQELGLSDDRFAVKIAGDVDPASRFVFKKLMEKYKDRQR